VLPTSTAHHRLILLELPAHLGGQLGLFLVEI
jgi:hypothetical protein